MESSKRKPDKANRPPRANARRKVKAATAVTKRTAAKQIRGSVGRSDAVIAFIEQLKIPSGIGQGEPFTLSDWQKDFIRNIYDPTDEQTGKRRIRKALLSMGRKNGKSALAAAFVLVHLVGPMAKINGEVFSAATDRHQAGLIYKMCKQIIELDPELSAMCVCHDSIKRIACHHLGSFYVALSADARRQHGGNPSFVIYDELAQALNSEMYDVLDTSFGAQEEALFLVISTQSSDPQSKMTELCDDALAQAFGSLKDPTFYGRVYAVPDDADPYDESVWHLGNPALGDFQSMADFRAQAQKAQRSPSAEAGFRNLKLNQRVDSVQALVNSRDWVACQGEIDENELLKAPLFCGLDLSSRQDLTALSFTWRCATRVVTRTMFWTPADELKERAKRDGAPYLEWHKARYLNVCEGRSIDYRYIAQQVWPIISRYNLIAVGFDRWRIEEFKRAIMDEGQKVDNWKLIEVGQGFKDQAPAIEELEQLVIEHKLLHDGNPLQTYCLSNVRVITDPAGNRKFDKRQRNRRIDGVSALANALSAGVKAERPEPEGPSVYEKRGIRVF